MKVIMNDQVSDDFKVNTGLQQGCVLSPLVFSLYINGAVKKLKGERCGVECGGETIPGLLFADNTCLMLSDAAGLRKSLDVLVEWCREWGVKAKSGATRRQRGVSWHMRWMVRQSQWLNKY